MTWRDPAKRMGSGVDRPRTNDPPSSAAMLVPVVPTPVHPVFDRFAAPRPAGGPKAIGLALEPATSTQPRVARGLPFPSAWRSSRFER